MATEDEAKSEQQQQKDTDDEQQTKCKKRRIEKEKENLGLPIAQSTPLMPQCQPDQSIIIVRTTLGTAYHRQWHCRLQFLVITFHHLGQCRRKTASPSRQQ
ncbi:hypothetical protein niasHT_033328 [Heterodera trifolii]|uniref:Uncharacterized protein n=1 Tax=Heterodera trifolii TaxID=157864 RepID=A0ABD2I8E7_9BILA